jgi:hypothetical protein
VGRSGLRLIVEARRRTAVDVDRSLREITIIRPVEEATCTATWLKAAELLAGEDDGTLYNLILGVESPDRVEAACLSCTTF